MSRLTSYWFLDGRSVFILNGNGADVAKHAVPAVPTKRYLAFFYLSSFFLFGCVMHVEGCCILFMKMMTWSITLLAKQNFNYVQEDGSEEGTSLFQA